MEYVDKDKVLKDFKELLPWEKLEFIDKALNDIGESNLPEYLFGENGGWSPFDFITAAECVKHFDADDLMDEMYDSDIEEYVSNYPLSISSYALINALENRWLFGKTTYISDTNLKNLEELIEEIKKYKEENK